MKKKKYKAKDDNKDTLRQSFTRAAQELEVPIGAAVDLPSIEFTQTYVLIESHHGVTEYTTERICVAARDTMIRICGMDLELHSMNADELNVRGKIASVEFI